MWVGPGTGGQIDGNYATRSPEMRYRVNVGTACTYYVWLRVWAPDLSGDSVHMGLDGAAVNSAAKMTAPAVRQWTWMRQTIGNTPVSLNIPTGEARRQRLDARGRRLRRSPAADDERHFHAVRDLGSSKARGARDGPTLDTPGPCSARPAGGADRAGAHVPARAVSWPNPRTATSTWSAPGTTRRGTAG